MLARSNRLTGADNFKRVAKEGWGYLSTNFGVAIFDRKDSEPTRFGFVVSVKVAHAAVDRNYAKRKMSEGVRQSILRIKKGLDIVFLAKPSITRVETAQIMREVKKALEGAKVLQ